MRVTRLDAASRRVVPWKNGGGTTTEIAVYPSAAGFEDFQWRISMARVERGGPFSRFPGVDRVLAVLEGRMRLQVDGRAPVALSPDSEPLVFPGDAATQASVIEPVRDLNVMCRRGRFCAAVSRFDDVDLAIATGTLVLLSLGQATIRYSDGELGLQADDALLVEEGIGEQLQVDASTCYAISLHALG